MSYTLSKTLHLNQLSIQNITMVTQYVVIFDLRAILKVSVVTGPNFSQVLQRSFDDTIFLLACLHTLQTNTRVLLLCSEKHVPFSCQANQQKSQLDMPLDVQFHDQLRFNSAHNIIVGLLLSENVDYRYISIFICIYAYIYLSVCINLYIKY